MVEQTVRELLEGHVVLDVEGIDRLYLNLYQPMLQTGGGVATFFKVHRGAKVASTTLMAPMSHAFVKAIHDFAKHEGVEIVAFRQGAAQGRGDPASASRTSLPPRACSTSARHKSASPVSA